MLIASAMPDPKICACRGSCALESDVKFQFGPLLNKTDSSKSSYSEPPPHM